jgi:hypothetical protein
MNLDLAAEDLRGGLVALILTLAEIIKETLRLQALRRMEAGSLTDDEVERVGQALLALDEAFERIKLDLGVGEAVRAVRAGLDRAVQDLASSILDGERPEPAWSRAIA